MTTPEGRGIFSLNQARELLPQVKHLTADAVRQAEALAMQLHGLAEDDPEHVSLSAALKAVVDGWAGEVQSLGLEAKGLWLGRLRQRRGVLLLVLSRRDRRALSQL